MFTGLVEGTGKVTMLRRFGEELKLTIAPHFEMKDCRTGESICVDGVCLSVTEASESGFSADVSGETVSRSTLGQRRQGDEVNLERALRLMDRLGGHFVSGHIDGVGQIKARESRQKSWFLRIGLDETLSRYIIEKGSIAVDGVSLTVNACEKGFFEVNIIPQTGAETALLKKKVGDDVNIETDMIGKYVERFLSTDKEVQKETAKPGITADWLVSQGFGD